MNITAKSRYALKVMMDLALNLENGTCTRHDIARRQNLPLDYMDQIISRLKGCDLVKTTRGRSGGLILASDPKDITLWDIFSGVEDQIFAVACMDAQSGCAVEIDCLSKDVWERVYAGFQRHLKSLVLSELVGDKSLPVSDLNAPQVIECPAPKKTNFQQRNR